MTANSALASGYDKHQVVVLGSGISGLATALRLAKANIKVALITKKKITSGSTYSAQGGIAAVLDKNDHYRNHVLDTTKAGSGLVDIDIVNQVIYQAPEMIYWLEQCGVNFTTTNKKQDYHLTREGGHSHRRIVHIEDHTGQEVGAVLQKSVLAQKNISIYEHHIAVDIITTQTCKLSSTENRCIGVYAYDIKNKVVKTIPCRDLVIATGGACKIYLYTSNPDTSTGDGIAMAWRAGCRVSNLEFVQFHPTCLYHPHAKSFLLSETLRGEGAKLKLPNGEEFLSKYDKRAELAPRDIVARSIDQEIKKHGVDCVFLDITQKSSDFIKKHFPMIQKRCLQYGFDLCHDQIPVVPSAHYTCGGIMIDQYGQTDVDRLYAIGESACSGLHGANRLASNSLLECLVFAKSVAEKIQNSVVLEQHDIPKWDDSLVTAPCEQVEIAHNWDELRRCVWNYVGIVRSNERLQKATKRIETLETEINDFYSKYNINTDLIELRNLVLVAKKTVECALMRQESRGLHFNLDFPEKKQEAQPTVLVPPSYKTRS